MENEKTVRERLLDAGTEEFLAYGFKNASLRRICSAAGVTTGALYFLFKNKEDLFCQIVEGPLQVFMDMYKGLVRSEMDDLSTAFNNEDQVICMLMKYRRECILLLDKAAGTKYGDFRGKYMTGLVNTFQMFFDKYTKGRADPDLVELLAKMRFRGYLEIIYKDYPLEKARELVRDMAYYADAGFAALVEKINKEG